MTQKKATIQWVMNPGYQLDVEPEGPSGFLHPDRIVTARSFTRSVPGYQATPLVDLKNVAAEWKLKGIYVKDESRRFGLRSFKVLGGLFAISNVICHKLGISLHETPFKALAKAETLTQTGPMIFVTATDGNHGRGIAWAAKILGHQAVIFMPKGASPFRVERIRQEGAQVFVTDMNYDDTVRHAKAYADEQGGQVVQDTAWAGYEEIPAWIMQGYAVMMDEIRDQLEETGRPLPTHVFLQAGVGSFAASIQGYMAECWGPERPRTVVLEPDKADCFYRTISINDGLPHAVTGALDTIMAGLACGEPNLMAWRILRKYTQAFVACPDHLAARGMRILGAPVSGDAQVVAGESGAIGMGFLNELLRNPEAQPLRNKLRIDESSLVLVINTEGDTDPRHYREVVWEGRHASDTWGDKGEETPTP